MGNRSTIYGEVKLIRVCMLPGRTLSDDNQFINLLVKNLDPDIKVINFNWFYALFGSYNVLHIHWQERLYRGKNRFKSKVKHILLRLLFIRLKFGKSKVIWTVHNLAPHETPYKLEGRFERKFQSLVDIRVYMQPIEMPSQSQHYIPHGVYSPSENSVSGIEKNPEFTRIVCAGFLRPSKNLERLIRVFPESKFISLLIAGEPVSKLYGLELKEIGSSKKNIELRLGRLSQKELYELYKSADIAIVPYINTYNSGAAIYALSVPIPLLASESESMLTLQGEIGPGWMQLFRNDFDSEDILAAIERLSRFDRLRTEGPVFSNDRQWTRIGEKYSAIYRSEPVK